MYFFNLIKSNNIHIMFIIIVPDYVLIRSSGSSVFSQGISLTRICLQSVVDIPECYVISSSCIFFLATIIMTKQ